MPSNFHANTNYVKYAHNPRITVVKLHKKGRNRLKMPKEVQLRSPTLDAQSKHTLAPLQAQPICDRENSMRIRCFHLFAILFP